MIPAASVLTRVAIYARYSSDNQREASIEDQVRLCRARAEREGWQVAVVHTDYAVSGSTALRPGYQALLADIRDRRVGLVLAESLDRFSRDQEHIAGFYKQAQFAGVRVVTTAEGDISELHVGLKGTMGALYLRDLADKTRRGLEGRIRQGRSGGGLCYGYRIVRGPTDSRGEFERGLRAIDEQEASVVRRIFREFAEGRSPIAIARQLNTEQIPGPRGGLWSDGAIRGHARVGTGILRNQLYVGQLVWNRRRWLKEPNTGARLARHNQRDAVVTEQVPEWRIVDDALWSRVQERLAAAARPECRPRPKSSDADQPDHLWQYRRPRHVLSGRVVCGTCGANYMASARDYLACPTAIRKGACSNRVRLRRGKIEAQVLRALATQLMQPELVAEFVAEFTSEWNRLQANVGAGLVAKRRELENIERKLNGLIEAIADGLRAPGLQGRLDDLERRRTALQAELDAADRAPSLPVLHPNLATVYRERVGDLRAALASGSNQEALEATRALIDRVEVHPPATVGGDPRIELVGHLAAMLRLATGQGPGNGKSPSTGADGLDVFLSTESGDAGTRKRLDLLLEG